MKTVLLLFSVPEADLVGGLQVHADGGGPAVGSPVAVGDEAGVVRQLLLARPAALAAVAGAVFGSLTLPQLAAAVKEVCG